jgi:hypothetical protein
VKRVGFKLHENLIHHLVDHQSATAERALIELVMNSADAGASRVEITLDDAGFKLVDDGKGFPSEASIRQFFATFGSPQTEEKTFGRYRVGRAQIFGWASTVWDSNAFRMDVDLKRDPQGFALSSLRKKVSGCQVTGTWNDQFRRRYPPGCIPALERALRDALLFPPVEVWINGDVAAKPTHAQDWSSETAQAYFRLQTHGGLAVFNQGVFVCELPHAAFHVGGVLVSKEALPLTMSRNEVVTHAPEWQAIAAHIKERADALHQAGASVGTDEFRSYALRKSFEGGDTGAAVITIVPKRQITLQAFAASLSRTQTLVYAGRGDVLFTEEAVRSMGLQAAVLHFDTLERVAEILTMRGATNAEIVCRLLDQVNDAYPLGPIRVLNGVDLPRKDSVYRVLEEQELVGPEKDARGWIEAAFYYFAAAVGIEARSVLIAETPANVAGFTDGRGFIALSRPLVARAMRRVKGAVLELAMTGVHELCHETDSQNAGHSPEFYETYHRLTVDRSAAFDRLVSALERTLPWRRKGVSVGLPPTPAKSWNWWGEQEVSANDTIHVIYQEATNLFPLVSAGEISVEMANRRLGSAYNRAVAADNHISVRLGDPPLRATLEGPVMGLMMLHPFTRAPTGAMLSSFSDGDWGPLGFHAYSNGGLYTLWEGEPVARLELRKKGVVLTRKAWALVEPRLTELVAKHRQSLPWIDEQPIEVALAWICIAKLTVAEWQGSVSDSGPRVRVHCVGDPPGTYRRIDDAPFSFWADENAYYGRGGEAWQKALFEHNPSLSLLDPVVFHREAIELFEREAAEAVDFNSFWLRWAP